MRSLKCILCGLLLERTLNVFFEMDNIVRAIQTGAVMISAAIILWRDRSND